MNQATESQLTENYTIDTIDWSVYKNWVCCTDEEKFDAKYMRSVVALSEMYTLQFLAKSADLSEREFEKLINLCQKNLNQLNLENTDPQEMLDDFIAEIAAFFAVVAQDKKLIEFGNLPAQMKKDYSQLTDFYTVDYLHKTLDKFIKFDDLKSFILSAIKNNKLVLMSIVSFLLFLVFVFIVSNVVHVANKIPDIASMPGVALPSVDVNAANPSNQNTANTLNQKIATGQANPSMDLVIAMGAAPGSVPAEKRVYVFTDPDCPYCQKIEPTLEQMASEGYSVTIFPVAIHESSKEKVRAIACAANTEKLKIWQSFMSGKESKVKYDSQCQSGLDADVRALGFFENAGLEYTPTLINDYGVVLTGNQNATVIKEFLHRIK